MDWILRFLFGLLALFQNESPWIVYLDEITLADVPCDIYRMHPDGSEAECVFQDDVMTRAPRISPDGNHILIPTFYLVDYHIALDLYTIDIDGGHPQLIGEGIYLGSSLPGWSLDSEWIVFLAQMESVSPAVYRVHPDGSHLEKISDEYTAGLSWTPDGQWLTYTNSIDRYEERGIFRMRPDGSQTEQIYEGPAEYFAWSPDSQYIAFTQWENMYWMTADGSEVQQLTDSPVSIWSPVWSPTGEWIVFAAGHKGMEHGGGYDSDVYIYQIRPDGSGMRRLHQGEHWRDIWANDWTPFYCEPYLCAQTDTEILYFEDGWNITWTPEVSHE